MNENIDLTKVLKDCPKGTKLYTPVWGEVVFVEVVESGNNLYPILIFDSINNYIYLTKDGHYLLNRKDSECILFPSKDQRDWSKFTASWYKKEMSTIAQIEKQGEQEEPQVYETEDSKIITYSETDGYKFDEPNFHENERVWLYLVSDVLTWKDGIGQYLDNPRVQELAKKLCSKYSQKLYNPSILSNSSNTGKNEQKFDPKTLKPFDKVLMRDFPWEKWNCQFFSYISNNNHPYAAVYGLYKMCIPYNEDTKHLVGTKDEAPEFYRYWKE